MEPKAALRDLKWHVEYARKQQIARLTDHLDEGKTISQFLHQPSEWQVDDLIRQFKFYFADIEVAFKEPEKKPLLERLQFWK